MSEILITKLLNFLRLKNCTNGRYPELESKSDPQKLQKVQEERKKRIVEGVVESRRSHRKDSFQKLKPLRSGDVVEKGKRKPKRRAEFSIGDKVKANFKNSRSKYPGTVVSFGKGVYGIQFDDGDFDPNVPRKKVKLISEACTNKDTIENGKSKVSKASTSASTSNSDKRCCVCEE